MIRSGGKVAILGGGMAGLSAAWRLSEPGWRNRFDSITVYQRGWRLGGKGASSRGPHGRIEEHGLHIWLGCYENAFGLLRECYAELDRATTDPKAPIRSWDEALIPAETIGLAEQWGDDDWLVWLGRFSHNNESPGDPQHGGREMTVPGFIRRAMRLILDFTDSLRGTEPVGLVLSTSAHRKPPAQWIHAVQSGIVAASLAFADPQPSSTPTRLLGSVLDAVRRALDYEQRPDHRRSWLLISLVTATVRGIIADNLATHPHGFKSINDEDFTEWVLRHGAHPDVVEFPLVRGLYDFVFGHQDADHDRPAMGAGVAVFLIGVALFQYRGSIFWKMTAGMGDVVIAPIYQALQRRGVEFEFFHRLDALHLDDRRQAIGAITMGRQARLVDGVDSYEPLTKVRGLPVFPNTPLLDQVVSRNGIQTLETYFGDKSDVEKRVLRRGEDFDHVVLAVSIGMVGLVAGELIEDQPGWRDMTTHIRTVATQAVQIWLRPHERTLGWNRQGVTTSAYLPPFETWASMGQTLWAEDWPEDDRPGSVAYFCGTLDAPWPAAEPHEAYTRRYREQVYADAVKHLDSHFRLYFPGAVTDQGFAWNLLSGVNGSRDSSALATQHLSVNIDPSDRYVQAVPGSDKYRLRPDESGYDNLVLAGDWTDTGWNAGCIEAAVISGLQAANALLGRGRYYRIRGWYLP
jgi:uncharacterized protein with NAD-binding domain and iron-sulfur cluster